MDKIHSIRQLYYEQGKTIPEIITETGHDRKTITKYLDMTDFNGSGTSDTGSGRYLPQTGTL